MNVTNTDANRADVANALRDLADVRHLMTRAFADLAAIRSQLAAVVPVLDPASSGTPGVPGAVVGPLGGVLAQICELQRQVGRAHIDLTSLYVQHQKASRSTR